MTPSEATEGLALTFHTEYHQRQKHRNKNLLQCSIVHDTMRRHYPRLGTFMTCIVAAVQIWLTLSRRFRITQVLMAEKPRASITITLITSSFPFLGRDVHASFGKRQKIKDHVAE